MKTLPTNTILPGDASSRLRELPDQSVDTVVTSPPYVALRNYFHPDQIGAEPSVEVWIDQLSIVMGEVGRVLKPTGTVWLNLGDSYSRHPRHGALPKSRLMAPERLIIRLMESGWMVRNVIAWVKPNPTPSSVADRLTCSWEPVYLLTRSQHYHFDLDQIRIPHRSRRSPSKTVRRRAHRAPWSGPLAGDQSGLDRLHAQGLPGHPLGKNPGDAWVIPTSAFRGSHHASYPETLVERPIQAGCPERICNSCGKPWQRTPVNRQLGHLAVLGDLHPVCHHGSGWRPGVVLDPFMGSGTTAVVAERLGRRWLGIELNPDFVTLAKRRLTQARRDESRPSIRSPAEPPTTEAA